MAGETATATTTPSPPRKRRRLRRLIGFVLLILLALVIIAPYIIGQTSLRNVLLQAAFRDLNGTISASGARIGWFSPIAFYGIEIRAPAGPPILSVASFSGDVPLWRLLFSPAELGNFRCEHPHARLVVGPHDSNFKIAFTRPEEKNEPHRAKPLAGVPKVNVSLALVDGSLSLERVERDVLRPPVDDPGRWQTSGINIAGGIRPSAADDQESILFIEPGTLIDHATITPDVTYAWLRYIAPLMAGATQTSGSFSLKFDQWRIPLDAPQSGTLGGQFIVHSMDLKPGPIGQLICSLLQIDSSMVATQETAIKFQLHDGRMYHENLQFLLGGLPVRTHGSVGLDQSLDVVAEVTLPEFKNQQAPLRNVLSGRTIAFPVRGTLAKPQIDRDALAQTGMGILNDFLARLSQNRGAPRSSDQLPGASPVPETLPAPEPIPGGNPAAGNPPAAPPIASAEDWEETLRQAIPLVQEAVRNRMARRRQQLEAEQQERDSGVKPPSDAMPPEFPRGRLRGRVRRLLDSLGPPQESDIPDRPQKPPAPSEPAPERDGDV